MYLCVVSRTAENGDVESLRKLIEGRVHVTASCLGMSAFSGRLPYLRHLVENLGMDIDAVDQYGRTAILRAVEGSQIDVFR